MLSKNPTILNQYRKDTEMAPYGFIPEIYVVCTAKTCCNMPQNVHEVVIQISAHFIFEKPLCTECEATM